jgi:hypothetical protein
MRVVQRLVLRDDELDVTVSCGLKVEKSRGIPEAIRL